MAIISNGTTVASGGTVQGSASNLTGIPAPSNSAILTGVASVPTGAVGIYIAMNIGSFSKTNNQTFASNNAMKYCSFGGNEISGGVQPGGTYRSMGEAEGNANNQDKKSTIFLRIS